MSHTGKRIRTHTLAGIPIQFNLELVWVSAFEMRAFHVMRLFAADAARRLTNNENMKQKSESISVPWPPPFIIHSIFENLHLLDDTLQMKQIWKVHPEAWGMRETTRSFFNWQSHLIEGLMSPRPSRTQATEWEHSRDSFNCIFWEEYLLCNWRLSNRKVK